MKLNFRMKIIISLLSTSFTLLGIEGALRWLDPWGMRYFWDVADVWNHTRPSVNRVVVLAPGTYHLRGWTVTELENFTRRVPASQGGSCQVVFVGDSMTWGHGVDDDQTWVNLVAAQLEGTTVINAGFDKYNSENARRTLADFPDADLFVYLIIDNDEQPTLGPTRQTTASMTKMYLAYAFSYLTPRSTESSFRRDVARETSRFQSDIEQLATDDRVIFVGFQEPLAESLVPGYPITLIPLPERTLSIVDRHPDPQGHRQIAAALLPTIQAAVAERCP